MRRHRKLEPLPALDGVYFHDPSSPTGESFLTFDQLKEGCEQLMDPKLANAVARDFGKVHYSQDPTYNLRRKK